MLQVKKKTKKQNNPQPYQIPLYYPPFPVLINNQPKQPSIQREIANALRNYNSVNVAELKRLRGDLTAYRQEQQSVFKTKVAYPRASGIPQGIPPSTPSRDIVRGGETDMSSITTAAEPDSDYVPSSESESALLRRASSGAGRLTEPEMTTDTQFSPTDVSDFEGLTSGTSVGRGAGGGFKILKKVSFGEPMDLTEPESDFAPRATRSERAKRRARVYVDNASNRRLGRVGKSY